MANNQLNDVSGNLNVLLDFFSRYIVVSEEELDAMARIIQYMKPDKNTFLLKQGEVSSIAGFILKGAARSYYIDNQGVDHTIAFNFENEPIASLESFFGQVPSSCNSITLEPAEIIYVTHSDFFDFLKRFPNYERVLNEITREIILSDDVHRRLLRTSSARERYEMLCEIRPKVAKRIPLKYIASYLEMAMGTLSRVRAGKL